VKFIYLILAHKYPTYLKKLTESLDINKNYFIIHIDAKVDIQPYLNTFNPEYSGNVFFTPQRHNIIWGYFSMVEATMSMIKFCFKQGLKADYFHLLSGQDYPIKSNQDIQKFFMLSNRKSFLCNFSLPSEKWAYHDNGIIRYNYKWWLNKEYNPNYNNLGTKNASPPEMKWPEGIKPYGGSQWWSLHYTCVQFLYENCKDENPIFRFFRNCFIPDEMFVQTFLMNSSLKDTIVNNNLRYFRWEFQGSPHPIVLTLKNKDELSDNHNLFARKFDPTIDKEIIKIIDNKRKKQN